MKFMDFFKSKKINQIKTSQIYYAYSKNGKICCPFLFDKDKKQLKNLNTNQIIEYKGKSGGISAALANSFDYHDKYIIFENIIHTISKYTDGNNINCKSIQILGHNFKYHNEALRSLMIESLLSNNVYIKSEDLTSLTEQLKENITNVYENSDHSNEAL